MFIFFIFVNNLNSIGLSTSILDPVWRSCDTKTFLSIYIYRDLFTELNTNLADSARAAPANQKYQDLEKVCWFMAGFTPGASILL